MSAPLATTMGLYLAGDSLFAPDGAGRPVNGSFGDMLAALNGMPLVNAAGGGWQMKDAATTANGNGSTKYVPRRDMVLLSAGSNDAGQHQDARALDAFELGLRYFMFAVAAESRVSEQSYFAKTGAWTENIALPIYGSGKRCWTSANGATRTLQFTGKEAVFTVWGVDNAKFSAPWTGGCDFVIHDENGVLRFSGSTSNRCWDSPYFSPTAGGLVPIPCRVVFDTYGTHTLKITNLGNSTQQLWVDDLLVIGSMRPLVFMPLIAHSHPNFLLYGNPNLTDVVVDQFRARQQAAAADHPNLILVDIFHSLTDAMYHTDWYHFKTEGHEQLLENFLAAVPSIPFSTTP